MKVRHKITYFFLALLVVVLIAGTIKSFTSGNAGLRVPTLTQAQKSKSVSKPPISKAVQGTSYQPTKDDLANTNFIASGDLTKVGQFTVDSSGLATELQARTDSNQLVTNGKVVYRILNVSIYENTARTDESLQNARLAYSKPALKNKFKTLVIEYMLANSNNMTVTTDGISTVAFNNQNVISTLNGLQNDTSLANSGVAEGLTVTTGASAILPANLPDKGQLTVQFASVKRAGTVDVLSEPAKEIRIKY